MTLSVTGLDHLVLNVADVERSAEWYGSVLGMAREDHVGRTAMTFGAMKINLRPVTASQAAWFTGERPMPGSDDLCFLTSETPEAVLAHLAACGVEPILGPVTKRGARGEICSVYCRDPDGNLIEISSYP